MIRNAAHKAYGTGRQRGTKGVHWASQSVFNSLGNAHGLNDSQNDRLRHRATVFPLQSHGCVPLFLECKARGLTSTSASDLVALVKDNALYLALYHPVSMALCFAWMWPLFCSFVDISLSVRGFSCLPPNTWQDDVALALGNIQVPQSLTLGASVTIQSTSEWWTGSSALPGCIPLAPKCAFCWYLWLSFFPGVFFTKVGCHRAPRVITVTVEQKLGWPTQVAQSCFHHRENVFLWGRNKSPLWHAAFTLNTHRKKDSSFFSLTLSILRQCL